MKTPTRIPFLLLVTVGCISCAGPPPRDFGPSTDEVLTAAFMKENFGPSAYPDVAANAQCPGTQEVSVSVTEQRQGYRKLSSFPGIAVPYQEFALSVRRYVVEALRESKVRVSPTGGAVIQVAIDDLSINTGFGPAAGTAKLAITVPAWGHAATYVGKETSGTVQRAIAYSVHMSILAFLNDPAVVGRLQCRQ